MKKTWITVKRGLLDPKHVDRLGIRFYLYLYCLDQANWEQGKVLFYRDRDASDELGISISTIRKQRVKLEEDGYISCLQKSNHQTITIHNWTNPREYSGAVYNKSTQKCALLNEEKNKGNHKGNTTMGTLSSNSKIKNHTSDEQGKIYNDMFEYFINECKFREPKIPSGKFDIAWDEPIKDVLHLVDWNFEKAVLLIKTAVERADKSHLSITTPKSLLNIIHGVAGEEARSKSVSVGKEFNPSEVL